MQRRLWIAPMAWVAFTIACGRDLPVVTPGPTPTPAATPPPAPTPAPVPSPEPAPTPTPSGNRPPTVSVSGGGACHPVRRFSGAVEPCRLDFEAVASDPDGDHLTYSWSGCASGSGTRATCSIDAVQTFTARVTVRDGSGGSAQASGTALGVNLPPNVRVGGPPSPALSNTFYPTAGNQPDDPEEDADPNQLCTHASVTAHGPCRAVLAQCGGVGDVFDVDITTLAGPGTCTLEAKVSDPWGAVGTDRYVFEVLPPR